MALQVQIWALEVLTSVQEASLVGIVTLLNIYNEHRSAERRNLPLYRIDTCWTMMEDDQYGSERNNTQRAAGQGFTFFTLTN